MIAFRASALSAGLLAAIGLAACGGSTPSAPQSPGPGSGDATQITGRERFGWDQVADDINSHHFAVYVDNNRVELPSAVCRAAGQAYTCDSPLPSLSTGRHTLEVVAWISANGEMLESPRAAPLVVSVTGIAPSVEPTVTITGTPASPGAPHGTERITTGCGLSPLSDRALMMWDETGSIRTIDRVSRASQRIDWTRSDDNEWILSGVAAHPHFAENLRVYVAELHAAGEPRIRVSRYREIGHVLGERAVLLETSLPFRPARGVLTFGPDGRLYAALLSSPNAKSADADEKPRHFLVRLDENGSVPPDNDAGSIFARVSATTPLAVAWLPGDDRPWIVETNGAGGYRLWSARSPNSKQDLDAPSPPVAMQVVSSDTETRLLVTGSRGDVQQLDRTPAGWAHQSSLQLFERRRSIGDALAFADGAFAVCGRASSGPTRRYDLWGVRLPL